MIRRLIGVFAVASVATISLSVGLAMWSPVPADAVDRADLVGNFAGDGRDEIFRYVAGSGADAMLSLSNGGTSGGTVTRQSYPFTVSGTYDPVVGNFDGDAYDEIFWHGPGTAADSLWNFTSFTTYTTQAHAVGGTFTPLAGDFTGDGVDDVLWYAAGTAADFLWDFASSGSYVSTALTIDGTYSPVAGSFGNNETDDVLWYAQGAGNDFLWDFNPGSTSYSSSPLPVSGTFQPVTLDIRNQGWSGGDIFWYAAGTAADYLWDFNAGIYSSFADPVNVTYYSVAAGDFFGDSSDDIFWFGTSTEVLWDHIPDAESGGYIRWNYNFAVASAAVESTGLDSAGVEPSGRVILDL